MQAYDDRELDEIELQEQRAAEARLEKERQQEAAEQRAAAGGGDGGRLFGDVQDPAGANRVGLLRRTAQIPMKFVLEKLQLKLDASELYLDLIIFMPFLVMFVFFFYNGRDTEHNYYVAQGLRQMYETTEFPNLEWYTYLTHAEESVGARLWVELDKNYWGIGNQGDYESWLADVVVHATFECGQRNTSQAIAPGGIRAAIGQTLLIGAIRFRNIRNRIDSCAIDPYLAPANRSLFPSTCYARGNSAGDEDTSPYCQEVTDGNGNPVWTYYPCSAVPGVPTIGDEGIYHCGGHMFQIPFSWSCDMASALIGAATPTYCAPADNWGSRFAMTEFFAYAPNTDTFFTVKYFQEVDAAGWYRLKYTLRAFDVFSPNDTNQLIFEMFFLLFVLYYIVVFVVSAVKAYRESRLLAYCLEMWNILELANLICFIIIFSTRFAWMALSIKSNVKFPFADEYPAHLDLLQSLFYTQVLVNSVNTMLTFIKALKYVRLNAQLGVLTLTLSVCQQSIAGVLVLFLLVITSYAIAGWALFGVNLEEFCTIGFAFSTCMQMLVGNVNYDDMRTTNRFLAGPYFWSFVILGLYLLLNFIVAIIADTFSDISGKAFNQTMEELLFRFYQNMKAFLRIDNLRRIFNGIITGNSEPKLIRAMIAQLVERKALEEAALVAERETRRKAALLHGDNRQFEYDPLLDDDTEVEVMMKHEDFARWLDPSTYALLSALYFEYTWDEMMNEYDDAKKSNEAVDQRLMFDKVEEGVKRVVVDEIVKVEQLDEVLQSLETQVREMLDAASR